MMWASWPFALHRSKACFPQEQMWDFRQGALSPGKPLASQAVGDQSLQAGARCRGPLDRGGSVWPCGCRKICNKLRAALEPGRSSKRFHHRFPCLPSPAEVLPPPQHTAIDSSQHSITSRLQGRRFGDRSMQNRSSRPMAFCFEESKAAQSEPQEKQ